MGHVGIQPENVGLVAADDRTRAKHRFKFRAVGSSTQAFRHSFAVRTVGDWNSLPSHVSCSIQQSSCYTCYTEDSCRRAIIDSCQKQLSQISFHTLSFQKT